MISAALGVVRAHPRIEARGRLMGFIHIMWLQCQDAALASDYRRCSGCHHGMSESGGVLAWYLGGLQWVQVPKGGFGMN